MLLFIFVSCGNPVKILKKEIKKQGYIMYPQAIEQAGTGTLLGGSPNAVAYVAHPDTCFPTNIEPTQFLRRIDNVVLPSKAKKINTSGKLNAELIGVIGNGNGAISAGAGFSRVQEMELQFHDVQVEYFDLIHLKRYYNDYLDPTCKDFLNEVGFISQALKVGKMKFKFKSKNGFNIKLSAPVVEQILDLGVDLDYHIENEYTLVIDTPKYMGYQLGQLRYEDEGVSLYRASTVKRNKYQFKSISLFDDSRRVAPKSLFRRRPKVRLSADYLK
jgi:hypothetical protein